MQNFQRIRILKYINSVVIIITDKQREQRNADKLLTVISMISV